MTRRPAAASAMIVMVALLAAACSSGSGTSTPSAKKSSWLQAPVVDPPRPRPEFVLTDTSGKPFDFRAKTSGKLTLLYFGYTHCPDVCPINLAQVHEVLRSNALGDVQVVFVTVDPARDTPDRIRHWLDQIDPSFIGLTGTEQQIQAAERAAGVPVAVKEGTGSSYTVGHAAQVLVYAADDKSYVEFPFGTRQSTMEHDLNALIHLKSPAAAPSAGAARG